MAKASKTQNYEVALLVKPLLPFDVMQKVVTPLIESAQKLGGKMELLKDETGKEIEVAKKHLAYPIQKHEEGYYGFFSLQLEAAKLKDLEKQLKFNNDVIRFLILSEDSL